MPHDKNGVKLEVGDVVKGRGYNIKHEIIGRVVKVVEAESCNVTVSCVHAGSQLWSNLDPNYPARADSDYEYGAAKDFEKIA